MLWHIFYFVKKRKKIVEGPSVCPQGIKPVRQMKKSNIKEWNKLKTVVFGVACKTSNSWEIKFRDCSLIMGWGGWREIRGASKKLQQEGGLPIVFCLMRAGLEKNKLVFNHLLFHHIIC